MTALIDLFRSLSKTFDDVVLKVDKDLPEAEDIHPAIKKVGDYGADMRRLPAALAKLEALKVSAEASLPARDATIRKAKHAVTTLESKLKRLGEGLDRNLYAASDEKTTVVAKTTTGLGVDLPASRQDYIEKYRSDILAAEGELAKARDAVKKAESNRKGVVTRINNLAKEIGAAKQAIVAHAGRLEETVKVLQKTINHLRNRQKCRDRKRAPQTTAIETVDETAAEAPKGPDDEDIRKMAASHGLPIDCPSDLEAARQLFLN